MKRILSVLIVLMMISTIGVGTSEDALLGEVEELTEVTTQVTIPDVSDAIPEIVETESIANVENVDSINEEIEESKQEEETDASIDASILVEETPNSADTDQVSVQSDVTEEPEEGTSVDEVAVNEQPATEGDVSGEEADEPGERPDTSAEEEEAIVSPVINTENTYDADHDSEPETVPSSEEPIEGLDDIDAENAEDIDNTNADAVVEEDHSGESDIPTEDANIAESNDSVAYVPGYYQIVEGSVLYRDEQLLVSIGTLAESAIIYVQQVNDTTIKAVANCGNHEFNAVYFPATSISAMVESEEEYMASVLGIEFQDGIGLAPVVFAVAATDVELEENSDDAQAANEGVEEEAPSAAANEASEVTAAPVENETDEQENKEDETERFIIPVIIETSSEDQQKNEIEANETVVNEALISINEDENELDTKTEITAIVNQDAEVAESTVEDELTADVVEEEITVDEDSEIIAIDPTNASVSDVMAEFVMDGTTIVRYIGSSRTLVIPNDASLVTAIGEFAFTEVSSLEGVSIPDTITAIGTGAFNHCVNLITVSLPSTLTQIPDQVFKDCTNLQTISIPSGVTKIGDRAFENCTALRNLVLPSSLTEIGKHAFYHDTLLGNMGFPFSLTTIGDHAFEGCVSMTSVSLNDGLSIVKDYAFADCTGLTSVYFPDTLSEIGSYAFTNDTGLKEILIPASVNKIGAHAFQNLSSKPTISIYNASCAIGNYALGTNAIVAGYHTSTSHEYANSYSGITFCAIETRNFVNNAYQRLANRAPDTDELNGWSIPLTAQTATGADLIKALVLSNEFESRNMVNADIVEVLYEAMMQRVVDAVGDETFTTALDDHVSVAYVMNQLATSDEFANKCATVYYILPGNVALTEARDKNINITRFVDRLYRLILDREPDIEGLNGWCTYLLSGSKLCASIVNEFITSNEFTGRNLSFEDQTEIMYEAMLGRASDASGKEGWVSLLKKGCSIQYIANGFATSREFRNICTSYGLLPGSIELTQARDKNLNVTGFVTRCYEAALNRSPDAESLNSWCNALLNVAVTPQQLANAILFSQEAGNMNWDNEEFVEQLYLSYLGRPSDTTGKAGLLNNLATGVMTRSQAADFIAESDEFAAVLNSLGIVTGQ